MRPKSERAEEAKVIPFVPAFRHVQASGKDRDRSSVHVEGRIENGPAIPGQDHALAIEVAEGLAFGGAARRNLCGGARLGFPVSVPYSTACPMHRCFAAQRGATRGGHC